MENEKQEYTCSNCDVSVKEDAEECPACKSSFEDDRSEISATQHGVNKFNKKVCPICDNKEIWSGKAKLLYGVPVCKSCSASLDYRRSIAFLIDLVMFPALIMIGASVGLLIFGKIADEDIKVILGGLIN